MLRFLRRCLVLVAGHGLWWGDEDMTQAGHRRLFFWLLFALVLFVGLGWGM